MNNKTALVTGAAKRIGREICLFLAKKQYNILAHYNHSESEAIKLKTEIENLDVSCKISQADFNNENEVSNLFTQESIDLLINNASSFVNDNTFNINYSNLENHYKTNLFAPIILSQRFYNHLSSRGSSGNVINMLDYSITKMPRNFLSYALSKKTLWEFTQVAAFEMAPNIRVNGIALNNTLKAEKQSEANFIKSIQKSPLQIHPSIEEICQTIEFILSTPSMTGQVIFLDGGMHLNFPQQL